MNIPLCFLGVVREHSTLVQACAKLETRSAEGKFCGILRVSLVLLYPLEKNEGLVYAEETIVFHHELVCICEGVGN